MAESNSSTMDATRAANVFDTFGFSRHEVDPAGTFRSTNVFNQGEPPLDTSDSTISPNYNLQPGFYASASLHNGKSRLPVANKGF